MVDENFQAPTIAEIKFTVRPSNRDELWRLVCVYQSAYQGLEEYAYTSQTEIHDYLIWLFKGDPNGFFVADADGEIVGFVSVHSDWWDRKYQRRTAEVHEVVVKKQYQGKGIGRVLIHTSLNYARAQGCNYSSLWVGEHNLKARNWYKRLGFVEMGMGWGEWIRMVKNLCEEELKK